MVVLQSWCGWWAGKLGRPQGGQWGGRWARAQNTRSDAHVLAIPACRIHQRGVAAVEGRRETLGQLKAHRCDTREHYVVVAVPGSLREAIAGGSAAPLLGAIKAIEPLPMGMRLRGHSCCHSREERVGRIHIVVELCTNGATAEHFQAQHGRAGERAGEQERV